MPRKESILRNKSEAFAFRIIKLYQYLKNVKHELVISKQIYRSGTSIGAHQDPGLFHHNSQNKESLL